MNLGNYQKTPLGTSFARTAAQSVATALQQTGKALPCSVVAVSGQLVTVKFEVNAAPRTLPNITIPINTSAYDWLPIQVGDKGYTQTADVGLWAVSGQGTGAPPLVQRANLTALVFQPISQKSSTVPDANQRVVQGPHGVLLRTLDGNSSINVTEAAITMICQGKTVMLNGSGLTIDGILFDTHFHNAPSGGGDTGPPL